MRSTYLLTLLFGFILAHPIRLFSDRDSKVNLRSEANYDSEPLGIYHNPASMESEVFDIAVTEVLMSEIEWDDDDFETTFWEDVQDYVQEAVAYSIDMLTQTKESIVSFFQNLSLC